MESLHWHHTEQVLQGWKTKHIYTRICKGRASQVPAPHHNHNPEHPQLMESPKLCIHSTTNGTPITLISQSIPPSPEERDTQIATHNGRIQNYI